ncbi:AMP-dependent synthetase [Halobacteriales archaeon QS_3_64_16]|nr:MAG: AMP-dependent synthetase [Halobacteriales archaeon QS_3_64_16]
MSERGERLEAYRFHEREWESYEELYEAFEWEVPETFNMATYLCDRWAERGEGADDGGGNGRIAFYSENEAGERETYTFEELREAANGLADFLAARGVSRGDRVGVNVPQKPETVMAHLAAWKLGAVSVPLSTLFGPDALSYRLADSGALACVVDGSNVDALRDVGGDLDDLETVVTVDTAPENGEVGFEDAIDGEHAGDSDGPERDRETVATDAEEDAIVIYTSGTTGDPKGVRHAHRVLLGHLPLFLTTFCNMDIEESDVHWTPAEWAWIASLFDVVLPGLFYGKPVLAYSGGAFDAEAAFSLIERYELTNVFAPPTALRILMQADHSPYDLDSVRVLPSGGESLGDSIVTWAEEVFDGAAVQEGYGQTEANMIVGDCTALADFREGTIGLPGPGHEVAIVDRETTEPLEAGTVGEIAVRYAGDPVCFKQYWKKPGATAEKVRDGWLCTEDLGEMSEDGYVTFHGRADDVIISAGYRIGPEEIEDCLASHDAVADTAVIGVPDEERGKVPKAFCVLATGYEPSEELKGDLREHVRERLAQYEYPRGIEFLEELPTTVTGKVRRASLRDREGLTEGA